MLGILLEESNFGKKLIQNIKGHTLLMELKLNLNKEIIFEVNVFNIIGEDDNYDIFEERIFCMDFYDEKKEYFDSLFIDGEINSTHSIKFHPDLLNKRLNVHLYEIPCILETLFEPHNLKSNMHLSIYIFIWMLIIFILFCIGIMEYFIKKLIYNNF